MRSSFSSVISLSIFLYTFSSSMTPLSPHLSHFHHHSFLFIPLSLPFPRPSSSRFPSLPTLSLLFVSFLSFNFLPSLFHQSPTALSIAHPLLSLSILYFFIMSSSLSLFFLFVSFFHPSLPHPPNCL